MLAAKFNNGNLGSDLKTYRQGWQGGGRRGWAVGAKVTGAQQGDAGARRDAAMPGMGAQDPRPSEPGTSTTSTRHPLCRGGETTRISRRAADTISSWLSLGCRCALNFISKQGRKKESATPHASPRHPGVFGRHPRLGAASLSPQSRCFPRLSAAEWLSEPCIIYPLGNICWDLVFNNCHSNISFLNPLRSVAVAILNIYQRSLCVHC